MTYSHFLSLWTLVAFILGYRWQDKDSHISGAPEDWFGDLYWPSQERSEKVGLKLNIQKTKIMTSGAITPWQIDGETIETVRDFTFLASKITVDGDYSHEIKKYLLLGRKAMINLDSILKSKETNLSTKVHIAKAMFFPVVMLLM